MWRSRLWRARLLARPKTVMPERLDHVHQGFGCVRPYVYRPLGLWDLVRGTFQPEEPDLVPDLAGTCLRPSGSESKRPGYGLPRRLARGLLRSSWR
jgi:hypothetical protein